VLCIEDLPCLDLKRWKKDGVIAYLSFEYTWRNHSGVLGSIYFQLSDDADSLKYITYSSASDDPQGQLEIITTNCNYGGHRYWFRCPRCDHKAVKLYIFEHRLQCQSCTGLPYKSQNETPSDRNIRRVRKVRRILGASDNILDPIIRRPKRMHHKTFERLRIKAESIDDIFNKWAHISDSSFDYGRGTN